MCNVAIFTFNPFQENTYVLFDETNECIIIDPGCYTKEERDTLKNFINEKKLKPVRLILTHSHIDHVLGNWFIADEYGLELEMHRNEVSGLVAAPHYGRAMYGIIMQPSPEPKHFIEEGDVIEFGNTQLKALFTPGHSPASLSFYCETGNFVIAGDVLFYQSIGRTDLPGGNFETLIDSIKTKLYPLGDDVKVFPGHGPETTIGFEKQHNPFLNGNY
jgi:glyoxylase-like metal-dependent hydrolase (beta-lactamase superfamily II)